MKQAIGIMGGTFDPIHYGHLTAAEFARAEFKLAKVLLMLAARPPHKQEELILDEEHRLEMLKLAIRDNKFLEVSALELNRPGYSYTIDTIRYFLDNCPQKKIYFIMGADALFTLHTWKEVDQLSRLCNFIVVTRPGYQLKKEDPQYDRLPPGFWDNVSNLEIPGFDFSSTEIRARVKQGKTIKYMVPPQVEQYIRRHNIYKLGEEDA